MKILVVDDEENNRVLLTEMLQGHGYEVVTADNGQEALEVARSTGVDLIVSDIMMPEMDGFDLCRHIKSDETLKALPFVFYTATYTEAQDERLAMELGASRFVVKPMEADAFIKVIREVIEKHEAAKLSVPTRLAQDAETLDNLHLQSVTRKLTKKVQQLEDTISALEKSEEQYRTLFESANDAILLLDGDCFVDCNAKALEMLRCTREQLIGQTPQWLSPEHQPDGSISKEMVVQQITAALQGEPQFFEWQTRRTDGSLFNAEVSLHCIEVADKPMLFAHVRDVTARKQAEQALWDSEEKYRQLFATVPDAIMAVDPETRQIVDVNAAAISLYGYTRDEFFSISYSEITAEPEESERSMEALLAGRLDRVPVRYHKKKDGTIFPVEISGSAFTLGGRRVLCGIVRDITERKRAESALRDERDTAQRYLDIAEVMFVVIGADQDVVLVNKKACAVLGYAEHDIVGKNWFDHFLPERLRGEVKAVFASLIAGDIAPVEYFENPVLTKSGEERIIAWHNTVLRDERGEITRTLGSGEDITERREAEKKLRESEARARSLVEAAPNVILHLSPDYRIVEFNPEAERLFGRKREEVLGENYLELFVPQQHQAAIAADIEKVLQGQPTRGYENPLRAHDGSERFVVWNVNPLLDSQDEPTGIIAIGQDITERKQAEAELQASEERYRRFISSNIAGIWWHDIVPPLPLDLPIDEQIAWILDKSVLVECNDVCAQMFGFACAEEAMGVSLRDSYGADEHTAAQVVRRFIHNGYQSDWVENYQQIRTGEYRWFLGTNRSVIEDGHLIQAWGTTIDITDRKRAEEALRLTQYSVDNCGTAIYWHRSDGTVFYANEAAGRQLGYSREELLSLSVSDIDPDWPAEYWPTGWQKVKEAGVLTFESRHRRKDGHVFPVEVTTNYFNCGGEEYVFAFVTDIAERKRAEEGLRDSETKLRAIFDHRYQLTGLLDPEGRLLAANRTALEFVGTDETEVIGHHFWNGPWWARSQKPEVRHAIERAARGECIRFETTHQSSDGEVRDVDFSLTPVQDDDGNVVYLVPEGRDITDRKRAEDALREHEAMIRALVETSRDWIWAIDLKGIHTYCNPAIEAILGYRPDDLVGKPSLDLIHEEDRKMVEAEFPKWIAEKRGWDGLALRWRHKDGSWRYLESNAVPIEDAAGELVGFRGVDRDITERRNAQQALGESEGRYRSLFEDAMDMIHIVDTNGIIIDANRAELETLGYTREEYIGKPLMGVIHPDRREDAMQAARSVLSGNSVHSHETVLITKSGEPIAVEVSAAPRVREGEVVAARAIVRDVRERKRAEEERRISEERFRSLMEHTTEGFYLFETPDPIPVGAPIDEQVREIYRGAIVECNNAQAQMYGHSTAEEVMGKTLSELHGGTDRIENIAFLKGFIEAGYHITGALSSELDRDGNPVWFSNTIVGIVEDDHVVRIWGTQTDVTETKQAEEKLADMEARLAHVSRLSTMGEMVAGIAHEVSQPLHAIVNHARATENLLEAERELNLSDLREWNAAIADSAGLASDVVRRMRAFARRGEADYSICSICEIVRESVQLVAFEARRCGAAVRWELPEPSPNVNVDRVQIQQVLVNLLRNAFEAMGEADAEVREVTIRVERAGKSVEVSVTDTGPGLPAHVDLNVFEPFATNKKDGLGLGLAISSSIVEAHDGELWADSAAAGGAAFCFTLPAFQEEFTDGG